MLRLYGATAPNGEMCLLPYARFAASVSVIPYAGLSKGFGAKRVMRFFPPIVTGTIVISGGPTLS